MTEVTKIQSSGLQKLASLIHVDKRKDEGWENNLDYHMANLPGSKIVLIFFENRHYKDDVQKLSEGDTTYYPTITSIPKYSVHKNNQKVSSALPRRDKHDNPFLFIPRGRKRMGIISKNMLQRSYYIYGIDDNYNIIESSSLFFNTQGGIYE